ncbi:MAG: hypothetical protein D6734_08815, partial [Candidatus Schekmanbacteria bacterium]
MNFKRIKEKDLAKLTEFIAEELKNNRTIRKKLLSDFLVQKFSLDNDDAILLIDEIEKRVDKSTEDEFLFLVSREFINNK